MIISLYDITNKMLSCYSDYIVDLVMLFGNSSISIREVVITSFCLKSTFQKSDPDSILKVSKSLELGMVLIFYTKVAKWLKKTQKV